MVGAGEWPPDEPGGIHGGTHVYSENTSASEAYSSASEEYFTAEESPVQQPTFPLGPGQWPALATRPTTPVQ